MPGKKEVRTWRKGGVAAKGLSGIAGGGRKQLVPERIRNSLGRYISSGKGKEDQPGTDTPFGSI